MPRRSMEYHDFGLVAKELRSSQYLICGRGRHRMHTYSTYILQPVTFRTSTYVQQVDAASENGKNESVCVCLPPVQSTHTLSVS